MASSLEEEIKKIYKESQITLKESSRGVFEVDVDNKLIFSKKKLDRFPYDKEILSLIKKTYKETNY